MIDLKAIVVYGAAALAGGIIAGFTGLIVGVAIVAAGYQVYRKDAVGSRLREIASNIFGVIFVALLGSILIAAVLSPGSCSDNSSHEFRAP